MSRTTYGEGSVYQRKDGRWVAVYHHEGKRREVYGKTEREAKCKRRERQDEIARGESGSRTRRTFGSEAQRWIDNSSKVGALSPRSRRVYVDVLQLHVIPIIGHLKMHDIRPSDITNVMVKMSESGKSGAYQKQARKAMSHVFQMSQKDKVITTNPALEVPTPRDIPKPTVILTREQAQEVFEAAPDERTRTALMILAHTGMRIGEMMALRWSDVRFPEASTDTGRIVIRESKSGRGRQVPVTPSLDRQLKLWRKEQTAMRLAARWWSEDADGFVISSDVGTQMDQQNWRRKHFNPVARPIAPGVVPHSLRHTCATFMMEEGIPSKVVAEVLGHSSTRITDDIYSHVTPRLIDGATSALERAWGGQVV